MYLVYTKKYIYIYTVHIHIAVEPPGTQAAHQLARKPRKMNKDPPEIPHKKKWISNLGKSLPNHPNPGLYPNYTPN